MPFRFNVTYAIISLYFLLSGVEYGKFYQYVWVLGMDLALYDTVLYLHFPCLTFSLKGIL